MPKITGTFTVEDCGYPAMILSGGTSDLVEGKQYEVFVSGIVKCSECNHFEPTSDNIGNCHLLDFRPEVDNDFFCKGFEQKPQ